MEELQEDFLEIIQEVHHMLQLIELATHRSTEYPPETGTHTRVLFTAIVEPEQTHRFSEHSQYLVHC